MAAKSKITSEENICTGMKSLVGKFQTSCDKVRLMEGNEDLYSQMQCTVKSLAAEVEDIDITTKIINFEESVKMEQYFYLNKTGISLKALPENSLLESAANILQETGIDDYNSSNLFTTYMLMIEKSVKEKEFVDDIDEHINKLKLVIEQQNDLKCELSNITYIPVGYTAEPININPVESVHTVDNCEQILELVKKIADIEKKQAAIFEETTILKLEQKKMYHELPPNMDQATMAVQVAEQTLKSMSKKLVEKLGKS